MSTRETAATFPYRDPSLWVAAGVHHDIQQFLFREALLLDNERYQEWAALLAHDLCYRTPVRFGHSIGIQPPLDPPYFEDDRQSLIAGINRLRERKPASSAGYRSCNVRVRRLVTNVLVCPHNRDEYDVLSYLLITRTHSAELGTWLVTAERHDKLRRAAQSFKIFNRTIAIDQYATTAGVVDLIL